MKLKRIAVVLLGLLALVFAQNEVRLDLKAFKVVTAQENGKAVERLQSALGAKPKDVVEYQLEAQNATERVLRQVALIIPIPRDLAYSPLSAQPFKQGNLLVAPEFSFDGGLTYGRPPLKRTVRVMEGGKEVTREVEVKPEEYTHARWVLAQMAAKEVATLKLRAVVR